MKRTVILMLLGCLGLYIACSPLFTVERGYSPAVFASVDSEAEQWPSSWIIRWEAGGAPYQSLPQWAESEMISEDPVWHSAVIRPKAGVDVSQWLEAWRADQSVAYIQPNHIYQVAAISDDPLMGNQLYLRAIHAEVAWDIVTQSNITIALVDTGVDLEHPDLKSNLIEGINLINHKLPPQDDHGHGTSVAGVLAAVGNNDRGVSGLLWKARVMPIKALEKDGGGEEARLGEGIRYAVDHGAKIVVLSLGLNSASQYMSEIVQYAEDKGVLLVSATGNEAAAVKYPAAYPTVLAVGGASADRQVADGSNYGLEMDIIAPWDVFTTTLGGNYGYKAGTSLAAPQVAAVAAMILAKYPDMKPYQIRHLLRQSAEDIGTIGWNADSGYGLLRADRALQMAYMPDFYEPNNERADAKALPPSKQSYGVIEVDDVDWFTIEAPYDGRLFLRLETENNNDAIRIVSHRRNGTEQPLSIEQSQAGVTIPVVKGNNEIRIEAVRQLDQAVAYKLTTLFQMNPDPFENNDRQYQAYALSPGKHTLQGTFHQPNDQDWYMLTFKRAGTLNLRMTTDSTRIDPVLLIQEQGGQEYIIDRNGDGKAESLMFHVKPTTYYIRASSATNVELAVVGEYTLEMDYTGDYTDPNEPNDRSYEATPLIADNEYSGVFHSIEDVDWFSFQLDRESDVYLRLWNLPKLAGVYMELYDYTITGVPVKINYPSNTEQTLSKRLPSGTYYIRLTTTRAFKNQLYQLRMQLDLRDEGMDSMLY